MDYLKFVTRVTSCRFLTSLRVPGLPSTILN